MTDWKPVPGRDGYEVNIDGTIRSIERWVRGRDGSQRRIAGKTLSPRIRADGTYAVNLWSQNTYKQIPVKVLVLEAFDRPCPAGFEAVNANGDLSDNRLKNLRWQMSPGGRKRQI